MTKEKLLENKKLLIGIGVALFTLAIAAGFIVSSNKNKANESALIDLKQGIKYEVDAEYDSKDKALESELIGLAISKEDAKKVSGIDVDITSVKDNLKGSLEVVDEKEVKHDVEFNYEVVDTTNPVIKLITTQVAQGEKTEAKDLIKVTDNSIKGEMVARTINSHKIRSLSGSCPEDIVLKLYGQEILNALR